MLRPLSICRECYCLIASLCTWAGTQANSGLMQGQDWFMGCSSGACACVCLHYLLDFCGQHFNVNNESVECKNVSTLLFCITFWFCGGKYLNVNNRSAKCKCVSNIIFWFCGKYFNVKSGSAKFKQFFLVKLQRSRRSRSS